LKKEIVSVIEDAVILPELVGVIWDLVGVKTYSDFDK